MADRVTIPMAGEDAPRGRGRWWLRGAGEGRAVVVVSCPGCGIDASLDHGVAPDGSVTPSLDCPECSFHAYARLEDWGFGRARMGVVRR